MSDNISERFAGIRGDKSNQNQNQPNPILSCLRKYLNALQVTDKQENP
jgi:hypothetical protein